MPLRDLIDLIFPRQCPGCSCYDHALCPVCLHALNAPRWVSASLPALAGVDGSTPLPVLAGSAYQGQIRAVITAWKSGQRPDVGGRICTQAAHHLAALFAPEQAIPLPQAVIPAPSGWRRRMSGKLVTRDLAQEIGRTLAIPWRDILRRRGAGQRGASGRRRAVNRSQGMHLRARPAAELRGAAVLLVDDVVTTGATLAACLRTLENAGITPIMAYVVAAAPPVDQSWGTLGATRIPDPPQRHRSSAGPLPPPSAASDSRVNKM